MSYGAGNVGGAGQGYGGYGNNVAGVNQGYGGGCGGGCGSSVGGVSSIGFILVLFILLVIITRSLCW